MNLPAGSLAAKPPIRLVDAEADLLADLALVIEPQSPELSRLILEEIDRAEIVASRQLPSDTVRIGSDVEFISESTGRTHRVKLVLPYEADIEKGAISVLTKAGAALIGLSAGQSIAWPDGHGGERLLTLVSVDPPV
ncbi:GreA/GreB family elongation factor [Sphingosinicella sp. CPCC 101087]|jgi:regulator of nucleoside diphosphate kinase|uniref:GreA/GreB family elongation factor n=1 Tax=Sphingosinicella sp. CPCC 101087 TaxID=2497754 RepID=UPI00101D25D9|nr:GreA/GreB family elongation factor [Sphingosinicella sp. CPCC 101087]